MVTPTKGARLGSSPAHERLILANLACSLFEYRKIKTTQVRAKRLQPLAERLITIAKRQTLASHRQLVAMIHNKTVAHILVTELAAQFETREGGYTRITKIERRKGDQAQMCIIELVEEPLVASSAYRKKSDAKTEDIKDQTEDISTEDGQEAEETEAVDEASNETQIDEETTSTDADISDEADGVSDTKSEDQTSEDK
jgi:large subunit ribosomal protein L17